MSFSKKSVHSAAAASGPHLDQTAGEPLGREQSEQSIGVPGTRAGRWTRRRQSNVRKKAVGVMVGVMLMPSLSIWAASSQPDISLAASPAPSECAAQEAGEPLWITASCVDPLYNRPVIDSETDLSIPVPHRKVSGHFEGTDKKFNFYFPPKSQWEGRFFQLVYPLQDEHATDETVSFGADSGAYTVQTNGGGGYRVDAAAADRSRPSEPSRIAPGCGMEQFRSSRAFQPPFRTISSSGRLPASFWRTRQHRSRMG